jgi:HK97 family phage major capsid protein
MLKAKKERRGEVFQKLDDILKTADKEKRNLTDKETQEYADLEKEMDGLDKEIDMLQRQEERRLKLAGDKPADSAKNIAEEIESRDAGKNAKIEVTAKNLKTEEARNAKIFKMIQGEITGNTEMVIEARKALVEGGHFDDLLIDPQTGEKRAGFSTLTDGKGSIFLPTSVSKTVIDIAQKYGVIPKLALNLGNIIQSGLKVPQVLGRVNFSAVNQKNSISGSGFNLGGIQLQAHKWGAIVDWTNEADESVGAILMPIIFEKVAEGLAYVQDNVFFNGDGTSTYNGIKGLEGLTGTVNYVRTATAATTHTAFATISADDYLLPQASVAPGARTGCVYVMHPNMIFNLMKLKDSAGYYIYGKPSEVAPVGTLWGYPIETSEAFAFTDGTTKTACAFFNPKYVAFATGRALTATKLVEGTITDDDGNSVNLATADAQALRFTNLFDIMLATVTRTTAGTAQGAFSVLRTAAS